MARPWERLTSALVDHFKIFSLLRERYVSGRTGEDVEAVVLECADWVNVVALTEDEQVVIVRQFRFGSQADTLEIPGGMVDAGEAPRDAAERELREETGYAAKRWTAMGTVAPNPAFLRNRLHVFLAEGAERVAEQEQDPGEDIHVQTIPLANIDGLIADGTIDHALVLIAFQRLDLQRRGLIDGAERS